MLKFCIDKIDVKSLFRSFIFTVGHFFIDLTTSYYITGAKIELIALSSVVSPLLNGVWYYILDRFLFKKIIFFKLT